MFTVLLTYNRYEVVGYKMIFFGFSKIQSDGILSKSRAFNVSKMFHLPECKCDTFWRYIDTFGSPGGFFNIQMSGHIKIFELSLSFYKILANPDKIAIKILSRICKTSKM